MKKSILLISIAVAGWALSSCKKSYTCDCDISVYDSQGNFIATMGESMQSTYLTKGSAQKDCDDFKKSKTSTNSVVSCTLY